MSETSKRKTNPAFPARSRACMPPEGRGKRAVRTNLKSNRRGRMHEDASLFHGGGTVCVFAVSRHLRTWGDDDEKQSFSRRAACCTSAVYAREASQRSSLTCEILPQGPMFFHVLFCARDRRQRAQHSRSKLLLYTDLCILRLFSALMGSTTSPSLLELGVFLTQKDLRRQLAPTRRILVAVTDTQLTFRQ